ncbi:hypothetical protein FQN57_007215 [Myotisia sp. PD_48]|nr:hypothetical protein FQN57_007215 [Myotisia sp. PD_48]
MVLVTPSTISVALSSSIIGLFTFLLFLSGYVLQQQSVRNIQAVIQQSSTVKQYKTATSLSHLTVPAEAIRLWNQQENQKTHKIPAHTAQAAPSPFGRRTRRSKDQKPLSAEIKDAYLQILYKPSPADICSTLLFFESLNLNSTVPSERIILYPQAWDTRSPTKSVTSALKILKQSGSKINAIVQPIDISTMQDQVPSEAQLIKKASTRLAGYRRILFLRCPGQLVDIARLEQLFEGELLSTGTSQKGIKMNDGNTTPTWLPLGPFAIHRQLPAALLITTASSVDRGKSRWSEKKNIVSLNSHVLNPNSFQQRNSIMESAESSGRVPAPSYVYFERDTVGRRGGDVHYLKWKEQVQAVCPDVNIGI